jgi:hypothetical protein
MIESKVRSFGGLSLGARLWPILNGSFPSLRMSSSPVVLAGVDNFVENCCERAGAAAGAVARCPLHIF